MTDPSARLRPAHIGVGLVLIVVMALIFAPDIQYGGAAYLSSYSAEPGGARGLYQTLDRLGWQVTRRETRFQVPDADATILLLDPPIAPGARETGMVLEAVRRGARLLAVPTAGTALSDSLGIRVAPGIAFSAVGTGAADAGIRFEGTFERLLSPTDAGGRIPAEADTLLTVSWRREARPGIVGLPYGEGLIILVADASVFANMRQRELDEAVLAVRLIEWLERGRARQPIQFSEWHHGRGVHPSPMALFVEALFGTAPGRTLLVLVVAGAAFLVAVSARPIAPLPPSRIERRSPLEHVDALSRAYQQIGGTRVAARHLVRGLLRRRTVGARVARGEREYLRSVQDRFPQLEPEVQLLTEALQRRLAPPEFVRVGEAIHTIERTLTQ